MVFIIKPISAQLTKDKDLFGKMVFFFVILGSLLRMYNRSLKTKNQNPSRRRKETSMVRYTSVPIKWNIHESITVR